MLKKSLSIVALAGAFHAGMPESAIAQQTFAISSVFRQFCCTDWENRTATPTPEPNPGGGGPVLLGGVVNQPATVGRTISQAITGSAPFDLTIPAGLIGATTSAVGLPHPNPNFFSLTLMHSAFNEAAVLSEGGGPGQFEFCPEAVGPAVGACSGAGSATSGTQGFPYHGRIAVTPGANQFGGAMRMLGPGSVGLLNLQNTQGTRWTSLFFAAPFSFIGGGSAANPVTRIDVAGTQLRYSTPAKMPAALLSSVMTPTAAFGNMWTTGMLTVSQTQFGVPPFQAVTVTGSDDRVTSGPNAGTGNITLVSPLLYNTLTGGRTLVRANVLSMNVPEPAALAGVGLGALALVLAGVSRSRRK